MFFAATSWSGAWGVRCCHKPLSWAVPRTFSHILAMLENVGLKPICLSGLTGVEGCCLSRAPVREYVPSCAVPAGSGWREILARRENHLGARDAGALLAMGGGSLIHHHLLEVFV